MIDIIELFPVYSFAVCCFYYFPQFFIENPVMLSILPLILLIFSPDQGGQSMGYFMQQDVKRVFEL